MNPIHGCLVVIVGLGFIASTHGGAVASGLEVGGKPRVIVTTDGEIDDRCSMIRFLLYANHWHIRGLIISSSKHHWKGNDETPAFKWPGTDWLDKQLDAYAEVYPTLKQHESGYPSPKYLRRQVFVGNIELEGDMREATPGSDRIAAVLLQPDPSPVWLQAWGGPNTIARALKTIEEEHPARKAEVTSKARLFLITEQDQTFQTYILPNWPGLFTIVHHAYAAIAYQWDRHIPPELHPYFEVPWMKESILEGHGGLCSMYEARNCRFRSEGDSPAFMHMIDVGLRSLEHPTYGGWGGRFEWKRDAWRSSDDDGDRHKAIWRWAAAFQNDWAARADWCVKSYQEANHPPVVKVGHAMNLRAKAGDTVLLSAKGTEDPDGDAVTYRWWQYREPGTLKGVVDIHNAAAAEARFSVPVDAREGQTIHLICEVTDQGVPPLTRYQRVIVTIGS